MRLTSIDKYGSTRLLWDSVFRSGVAVISSSECVIGIEYCRLIFYLPSGCVVTTSAKRTFAHSRKATSKCFSTAECFHRWHIISIYARTLSRYRFPPLGRLFDLPRLLVLYKDEIRIQQRLVDAARFARNQDILGLAGVESARNDVKTVDEEMGWHQVNDDKH